MKDNQARIDRATPEPGRFDKEAVPRKPDQHQVFISYAREDSFWMSRIRDALDTLPDFRIQSWVDKDGLGPGQMIDPEIRKAIQDSSVALLLVSRAFVESQYIQEKEFGWIAERAEEGGLKIVFAPINGKDDQTPIHEYLRSSKLARTLGTIPLDSPLSPNYAQLNEADVEAQTKSVIAGIRRVLDPHFCRLERYLEAGYEIEEKVAEGDTAIIYRARRQEVEHSFAIKVLKRPDDMKWFQAALRKASNVTAVKNITPIYAFRFRANLGYCILRYVDGEALSEYVRNSHPIAVDFVAEVITKIGRSLLDLRSIPEFRNVHIGIRPSNILFETDTQEPFLSLAVRPENRQGIAHIKSLARNGTQANLEWSEERAYVVPEYLMHRVGITDASMTDQYLLGLTAHQMLTGRIPRHVDAEALAKGDVPEFRRVESIQSRRENKFEHLFAVVERMSSVDPDDRFPSLEAALQAVACPELHSLRAVKASHRRCTRRPDVRDRFYTRFYESFLSESEEARTLFRAHRYPAVDGLPSVRSKKWVHQRRVLGHAVLLLLNYYEQLLGGELEEPTVLSFYRDGHAQSQLSPSPKAYQQFLQAFLQTIAESDELWRGRGCEEHLREMWRAVLSPGIEYMAQSHPNQDA